MMLSGTNTVLNCMFTISYYLKDNSEMLYIVWEM